MRALAPEGGHGPPDRGVCARGVAVDVARVGEFGRGGGGDQVDFGVGEGFQGLGFCGGRLDGVRLRDSGWGAGGEGRGEERRGREKGTREGKGKGDVQ